MSEILLPATDAGVLAQVLAVALVGAAVVVITRRHRQWRPFVVGATLLALALLGLRALH